MRRRKKSHLGTDRPTTLRVETLQLTPSGFTDFYRTLMALRFPLPVDDVLELRALINHEVDRYQMPALTPEVAQFRAALEKAIGSFGVGKRHHRERLIRTLFMIRDLHVAHVGASRHKETSLRASLEKNMGERSRAAREGLLTFFLLIIATMLWLGLADASRLLPVVAGLSAVISWRRFSNLRALESLADTLRQQLNAVLRLRIRSVNWKTMIHKLALILGYKQIRGIEVFRMERHFEAHGAYQ
jgi:hypothetical protein